MSSFYPLLTYAIIDESGKFKDKDVICLAGILAGWEYWGVAGDRWQQVLNKHTIQYLHVKELRRWDGIYSEKKEVWGNAGRETVLLDFAEVIRTGSSVGRNITLYLSLDAAAWKSLSSEEQRRIGRPDLAVFDLFLAGMLFHGRDLFPPDFVVSLICDDEEEVALPIYRLMRASKLRNPDAKRIRSLAFCDDKSYPQLQIADFIANTFYRELIRARNTPELPQPEVFKAMVSGTRVHSIHIDERMLKEMASYPQGFVFQLVKNEARKQSWVT